MGVNMSKLKKPKKTRDPNVAMKGKVLSALRKLSWSCVSINNKYKKAKVAPSTYECSSCGKWCYNGKSESALLELKQNNPSKNVKNESVYRDHISPIVPVIKGWKWDWNTIINNMLMCDEDAIQILCFSCHEAKTYQENEQRKLLRQSDEL